MDVVNYALSKKLNWDNIKNKPFYDNTSTKTCSQTVWYGGYLSSVDDWTEIDNDLWQLLLTKNITISSRLGDFTYCNENDNTVEYLVSRSIHLNVSKTTNKAYIMDSAADGVHIDDIELTYEVITKDIKKIDYKYLPDELYRSKYVDIAGMERVIDKMNVDKGEYSIDETSLQIGQKWQFCTLRSNTDEKWIERDIYNVVFDEQGVYIGDPTLNEIPFCMTHNKIIFNKEYLYALNFASAKFVCVEGKVEEIKKIDEKFLPDSSKRMIVNITNDDGTYSADKTFSEILEFYNNGGSIYALCQDVLMPLLSINIDFVAIFCAFFPFDTKIDCGSLLIDINNNIDFQENVYYTVPEPIDGDENKFLKGDGTWSEITQKTVVNITYITSQNITSDMTYDEIMNAYNSGNEVIASVSFSRGGGGFIAFLSNTVNYIGFTSLLGYQITITHNNIISINLGTYVKYDSIVENFLEFGRVEEYIPTSDYSPATKKYVDDNKFGGSYNDLVDTPLSFNDAGELEVTLNGVTKTFVPK